MIILLLFFITSFSWATTLGEINAATGIANTLQGTATSNHKNTLDNVKNKVHNYENVQKKRLNQQADTQPSLQTRSISPDSSSANKSRPSMTNDSFRKPSESSSLDGITKQELEERLQDEEIYKEIKPADYKKGVQIFYKNPRCRPSQENCHRGAVLTNIKSVIFDYAHTRGSFSNIKQ